MGTPDFAVRSLDAIISDNYKIKAVITAKIIPFSMPIKNSLPTPEKRN